MRQIQTKRQLHPGIFCGGASSRLSLLGPTTVNITNKTNISKKTAVLYTARKNK